MKGKIIYKITRLSIYESNRNIILSAALISYYPLLKESFRFQKECFTDPSDAGINNPLEREDVRNDFLGNS